MKTKAVPLQVLRRFALGQLKPSSPQRQDGTFLGVNKIHLLPYVID